MASHPRVAPSRGSEAQTGVVISVELALALRAAGLVWSPAPGDHFAVPERDLDGQVFVISDMVISRMEVPGGPPVLAFNGTTEWALDSLDVDDALWLPREDQLRELLGPALLSLERLDGAAAGWAVTTTGGERHVDTSAAAAYARAVLGQAGAVGGLSGGPGGG